MAELLTPESLLALLALTSLEIVLGIDNIVFIAILTGRVAESQRARARRLGLGLAMVMRILLLLAISWVMRLTAPLLEVAGVSFSGRDLILLAGGVFLIAKATHEIHGQMEGPYGPDQAGGGSASFTSVVVQIGLLDIIFSLDSVITAVGMARHLAIMVVAVVLAVLIMMAFSGPVSSFIERHPTMRMLALAFLLLIGVMLTIEGFGKEIERAYIYFAMAFSLFVEVLNMRVRKKAEGV